MPIHIEQAPNGRFVARSSDFALVETSTGWAKTLAEDPDHAVCLKLALKRAQAVEAGTFNEPDTHIVRHHG